MSNVLQSSRDANYGEKIFDRKEDEGGFPDLPKVNELRMLLAEKVYDFDAAVADN